MHRTDFHCNDCGYHSPRWLGRCPACGAWDSFTAMKPVSPRKTGKTAPVLPSLQEIAVEEVRLPVGMAEFDRVLGGGIVPGSLILVGGDPGIGKSTLLLQVARLLSEKGSVLYVTGEESVRQLSLRARRLNVSTANVFIAAETNVEAIKEYVAAIGPCAVIIDSIQAMARAQVQALPGSVAQVRE